MMTRLKLTLGLIISAFLLQACDTVPEISSERFIDNQNGTLTDKETGLMWMRCSLGQKWTGNTCQGDPIKSNWTNASELASKHTFVGHQDWRVPTIDELSTIVFCSTGRTEMARPDGRFQRTTDGRCQEGSFQKPTINMAFFPATPADWYWSASPFVHHDRDAWGLNFSEGNVSWGVRGNESHIRLVRSISVN